MRHASGEMVCVFRQNVDEFWAACPRPVADLTVAAAVSISSSAPSKGRSSSSKGRHVFDTAPSKKNRPFEPKQKRQRAGSRRWSDFTTLTRAAGQAAKPVQPYSVALSFRPENGHV
jgi:hypothetical protein